MWTAGWGPALHEWDPESGEELRRVALPGEPVAVTANGHWAVTRDEKMQSLLFAVETGRTFPIPSGFTFPSALARNAERFIHAGKDAVVLIDLLSGAELARSPMLLSDRPVKHIEFAGDLAVVAGDRFVVCHDLAANRPVGRWTPNTRPVSAMSVAPDGKTVYVADSAGGVQALEVPTLAGIRRFGGGASALAVSPDGKAVAVGSQGAVEVWHSSEAKILARYPFPPQAYVSRIAFSEDGRAVVASALDAVRAFDLATGLGRSREDDAPAHDAVVRAVVVSPDGARIASCSTDSSSYAGTRDRVFTSDAVSLDVDNEVRSAARAVSLTFNADGRRLAAASLSELCIHDLETPLRRVSPFPILNASVDGLPVPTPILSWTSGGLCVLSSRGVHAVDSESGAESELLVARRGVRRLEDQSLGFDPEPTFTDVPHQERFLAISLDGSFVVSEYTTPKPEEAAMEIVLTNVATSERRTLGQRESPMLSAAFSPRGEWLVTGHADGRIVLWDVASGTPRGERTSLGLRAQVVALAVSPDGRHWLSIPDRGPLLLWLLASEEPIDELDLSANHDAASCATFTPDGRSIVVGTWRHQLLRFDLEPVP